LQDKAICIVGDFDADGATSTALCMLCLRDFGHKRTSYIVPNRFDNGYGLTEPVVELAEQNDTELLITVDNGISSHIGVAKAKAAGMKVLVTDHHLPSDNLPSADVILNPNLTDCQFPSKHLAGVGVAFYLMLAVRAKLISIDYFQTHRLPVPKIANYLDIVALGTVADVVPLDKNNRILVQQGVQRIRSKQSRPGIQALLDVSKRDPQKITSVDLGFVLGPRLNAAGRLDDMSTGIECLLAESYEEAYALATSLESLNQSRRNIEHEMQHEAESHLASIMLNQQDSPAGICVYQESFHVGIVGIVAGRLKEKYYRPTIVFASENDDEMKGSARSVPGLHMRDLLAHIDSQSPGLIKKYGGHAMAAGLSLEKNKYHAFCQAYQLASEAFTESLPKKAQVFSDGSLKNYEMTLDTASELNANIPWGQMFEAPLFDDVFAIEQQRIVGQKHLKLVVSRDGQYFDAIAFNVDLDVWPQSNPMRVHLVYQLDINEFNHRTNLQLMVRALVPCQYSH
ncbi:MAG: single-stranded-DNA-specific exonuclease RecJ, partial [Pseudomonadota bacterium]